jgi:hypothetical protein
MRLLTIATCAAAMAWLGVPSPTAARERFRCDPVPNTSELQAALNDFWGRSVRLCHRRDGRGLARAVPEENIVLADPEGLASIVEDYGPTAAMGILAHEWAHVIQGDDWGAGSELQADCLAGAFLRAYGIDREQLRAFEWLSLDSGDSRWRWDGHGLGHERRDAMLKGYLSFLSPGHAMQEACAAFRAGPQRRPRAGLSF